MFTRRWVRLLPVHCSCLLHSNKTRVLRVSDEIHLVLLYSFRSMSESETGISSSLKNLLTYLSIHSLSLLSKLYLNGFRLRKYVSSSYGRVMSRNTFSTLRQKLGAPSGPKWSRKSDCSRHDWEQRKQQSFGWQVITNGGNLPRFSFIMIKSSGTPGLCSLKNFDGVSLYILYPLTAK